MTVSTAKLEANRRNAQKSTGPRTRSGKERSSLNAVTHGLRAETLVLLDEDPQALEDRRVAWRACLLPRDEVELNVVDDAVVYSWMQDRARRAQAARLAANITNADNDRTVREADQVLCLGQKLFADRRGPLADYPHGNLQFHVTTRRVSHSELLDDPEDPPRLVLHLQATAGGCQWMLDRWAELRSILEDGLNWQAVDKLKGVRLLGRQPIEAVDDRNALLIFLACQRMEGKPVDTIPEIWCELEPNEKLRYAERLRGRGVDRLVPADAAAARQALLDLIDRTTAQIKVKAEEHCRRAEVVDALTADCLLFDDSPEGERLRRYELANGRAKVRALNELVIRQRSPSSVVSHQLSAIRGQLSVVSSDAEATPGAIAPNEPTGLSKQPGVESRESCCSPGEYTDVYENATNEPTDTLENVTNEPTAPRQNAMNEPTGRIENVTNEPIETQQNGANEPTDGIENVTNEPTDADGTVTNELKVINDGELADGLEASAGIDDGDIENSESAMFKHRAIPDNGNRLRPSLTSPVHRTRTIPAHVSHYGRLGCRMLNRNRRWLGLGSLSRSLWNRPSSR